METKQVRWPNFSAYNANLLKRSVNNGEQINHFFVVLPIEGELSENIKNAFIATGFSEDSDGRLVAPFSRALAEKLKNTKRVTLDTVDQKTIEESYYLEQQKQVSMPDVTPPVVETHTDVDEAVEPAVVESIASPIDSVPVLTEQARKEQKVAALFSAHLRAYSVSPLIHKSQSSGLVASIAIGDHDDASRQKRAAVMWFEDAKPHFAFKHGAQLNVIALDQPIDNGLSFNGFSIIEHGTKIDPRYKTAFERIELQEMTVGNVLQKKSANLQQRTIKHNTQGIFAPSECETLEYQTHKASAVIYLVEHNEQWLSSYAYDYQVGNYLNSGLMPNVRDHHFDSREAAAVASLDRLISTQARIAENARNSQDQIREANGVLNWANNLRNSLSQALDDSQDHLTSMGMAA